MKRLDELTKTELREIDNYLYSREPQLKQGIHKEIALNWILCMFKEIGYEGKKWDIFTK